MPSEDPSRTLSIKPMVKWGWTLGKRLFLTLFALLFISIATLSLQIYAYSFQSYPYPTDVAIVLGAAVWDGAPSPVFRERINHAITLYNNQQIQQIIFTGGIGENDQLSESEVAQHYATDQGVPAEGITIETQSKITYENLTGAKQIMEERGWETALIVSDPLHMRRAMTMAKDLQIEAYPSPTPTTRYRSWRSKLGFLRREVFFYGLYLSRQPFAKR